MDDSDVLRDVDVEGFRLTLWATTRTDWRGQTRLGYRFHDRNGAVLFEGEDFCGSPMHADDSDETLRALLGFLTLKPGDTDRDYFDDYTEDQMDFAQTDAEALAVYAMEPDEGFEAPAFVDWGRRA